MDCKQIYPLHFAEMKLRIQRFFSGDYPGECGERKPYSPLKVRRIWLASVTR